jgi:hypothetical protein
MAILAIAVFFVAGGGLLGRVNVAEAQRSRDRWHFDDAVPPGAGA